MHDRLIGYLLGALEIEEIASVEQVIAEDKDVRSLLELLRVSLTPLECHQAQVDVPAGLAARTCQLVRQLRMRDPNSSRRSCGG